MYHLAIVDDNKTWCFVLALRLQQQGYRVSTFTDVQDFLHEVGRFDLVLVDFSIPAPRYQRAMDGPELICRVKHQWDKPPLMILISSFFTTEMLKDMESICPEADAVLSKQLETTELFAQVRQLLADRTPGSRKGHRSRTSNLSTEAKLSIHA